MALDLAVLAVDRDAGEVAHMLVRARKLVEQRGLSAVLVARQRELQRIARGNGVLAGTRAIGLLAQRGVRGGAAMGLLALLRVRIMDVLERDARGVRPTQGELVAAQTDLDGIAHGGVLHHGDLGTGGEAHVEDVLAQGLIVRIDRRHHGVLANGKLVEPERPIAGYRLFRRGFRLRGSSTLPVGFFIASLASMLKLFLVHSTRPLPQRMQQAKSTGRRRCGRPRRNVSLGNFLVIIAPARSFVEGD